jgi:DNA adenine methylase
MPFLKWVGGKRQLLNDLRAHLPARFGTYHEPFVGGGALFFDLQPKAAVLSDMNERLIRTYRGVRDHLDDVVALLKTYPYDKAFYLDARTWTIDERSDAEVAAWMIYLNHTGFNGLYRVNSRNIFNVPFGRYTNPNICDEPTLRACSRVLKGVDLHISSFRSVLERAVRGDFVYFDPPYIPLSVSSSFTSYTSDNFGIEKQVELRDVARELKSRGVRVMLSNSSAPAVRELYRGFKLIEVQAQRRVNSQVSGRGRIAELLIL